MNQLGTWPLMSGTGEAILFWCVATIMVLGALGVLFFRKAAYAALCMVVVMLGLAVLYITHGAPFLGTVQIVVYTGAIMMLFLFVIMMIGLGASDEYQLQRPGTIVTAVLIALGLAAVLGSVIARSTWSTQVPESTVDPYSNEPVTSLALELFGEHWFSMQLAGALLITAAIGAMLLTHSDYLGPRTDQHGTAEAKMRAYKERGRHMGQLPAPGVYAHSDSVDVPALSGETLEPVEESVPRVIRVRGQVRTISQVDANIGKELAQIRMGENENAVFGPGSSARVPRSGALGMPGARAPQGLNQPVASTQAADDASASLDAASENNVNAEGEETK